MESAYTPSTDWGPHLPESSKRLEALERVVARHTANMALMITILQHHRLIDAETVREMMKL